MGQGSRVYANTVIGLDSTASRRVATPSGETQLTHQMISTELIIRMGNLSRSEPS